MIQNREWNGVYSSPSQEGGLGWKHTCSWDSWNNLLTQPHEFACEVNGVGSIVSLTDIIINQEQNNIQCSFNIIHHMIHDIIKQLCQLYFGPRGENTKREGVGGGGRNGKTWAVVQFHHSSFIHRNRQTKTKTTPNQCSVPHKSRNRG